MGAIAVPISRRRTRWKEGKARRKRLNGWQNERHGGDEWHSPRHESCMDDLVRTCSRMPRTVRHVVRCDFRARAARGDRSKGPPVRGCYWNPVSKVAARLPPSWAALGGTPLLFTLPPLFDAICTREPPTSVPFKITTWCSPRGKSPRPPPRSPTFPGGPLSRRGGGPRRPEPLARARHEKAGVPHRFA